MDLIERLRDGCVVRPKRWSGDTHDDLGGSIDEGATDALMTEAAAALEAAQMGLRYAVRVWVLPDEIEWSEEEIDKAVERIIGAAKKEAGRG